MMKAIAISVSAAVGICGVGRAHAELPEELAFSEGAINAVTIERGGERMVIYGGEGEAKAAIVLLTHSRRDLVEAARAAVGERTRVVAPEKSREYLEAPEAFWESFWEERFDYYKQQVNKVPLRALKVDRFVAEGDGVKWSGLDFHVMETPGYTRDGVTYLAEIGGQKVAFAGDLIWEGGRVFDFYSFQEAIPEAKVGGYHGYGGRLAKWIESLEKVAAEKPDLVVPSRGPVITDPAGDIARAIARVRKIYKNYLSTNALHWYFKEERMRICGERVLGEGAEVELMPYSEHVDLPGWCRHMGTTKLLVSEDGFGFVLDVGGAKQFEMLKQAVADGLIKKIEGIWVTHTHNDHTQSVRDAAAEFDCPVYAVAEVADVLENPGAWFLPGISANAVPEVEVKKDRERWKWREFSFTAHFFPGQMYNHGGLLVERPGHTPVFFIGDSFSPSGIDDYCLMNRNLMREDTGYLHCLRKVRALPEGSWLVNEHIPHLFRFTEEELDELERKYRERAATLAELVPWDDVNYGIDEEWAWFYPYGSGAKLGQRLDVELRIWNHSQRERTFHITIDEAEGLEVVGEVKPLTLGPRETGAARVTLLVTEGKGAGVRVITASLRSEGIAVDHWCEALVKVGIP